MVDLMDSAVRKMGDHLVATTTSPLVFPACVSAAANARSEAPLPYISAVSNQLMPPASEASTTWSTTDCGIASQKLPGQTLAGRELPAAEPHWGHLDIRLPQPASRRHLFLPWRPSSNQLKTRESALARLYRRIQKETDGEVTVRRRAFPGSIGESVIGRQGEERNGTAAKGA